MTEKSIQVYMVTHGPECSEPQDYVVPLECGASLRDIFRYSLKDNQTADNISHKNRDWCELTGLYYIWKNDQHDITGLYHYRRKFLLSRKKIIQVLSEYDLIASERVEKVTSKNFLLSYCPSGSYEVLMSVIKDNYPEYYDAALEQSDSHSYYPCQMFVAAHKLMADYCSWLFPVLSEVEKRLSPEKQDSRYMGYLAEIICMGTYIRKNKLNVYAVNICVDGGTALVNKFMRTGFYCSHFSNRLKVFLLDKVYRSS